MNRLVLSIVAAAIVLVAPRPAAAQYLCPVGIELNGKKVLAAQIRDTERPSTDVLWQLLMTLSFSPTEDGKTLPNAADAKATTLKGKVRVQINGAGEVSLGELGLVQNRNNAGAWVIAPGDVTRILEMRKASAK